ncbi:MAG: class I SAM-dependent methyltransferase [Bryobacteraceae bacterium]
MGNTKKPALGFLLFFRVDFMSAQPDFLYDQFPYEGFPITATHPDRIIPVAKLLGMEPAPATACRVLELGCGDGANILPMAAVMTGSHFVGIDLAQHPIEKATAMAQAMGLKNIRFQQMNVMDLDAGFGEFDYILAHGLYSWVPDVVRDKVMSVCGSLLSPNGIAYISYNVYPGCHVRKMMSGMMLYHAAGAQGPYEQVAKAQEVLAFLASGKPDAVALTDELKQLRDRRDYSILHDDLSGENNPVYFHEFAAHAAEHGLQFLAECDFYEMQPYNFPRETQEKLTAFAAGDTIRYEQYLDFLKNRRFRKTLLCRKEMSVQRTPAAGVIQEMYLTSVARPVSGNPDIRSTKEEEFRGTKGGALRTGLPLLKAAIVRLGQSWPAPIGFEQLLRDIAEYRDDLSEEATGLFREMMLRCFMAGMVELHALPASFITSVSEKPLAFPYARQQAQNGEKSVCNLRHTVIEMDEASLHLLALLDGAHDVAAIHKQLVDMGLTAENGRAIQVEEVQDNIGKIAQSALLIA